ncbi:hypothetical protein OHA98_38240 [Streptomyces sp. NBC_00654]|uniref:hypothetical protein n=1 Tax=Streptomyces sp. NBC_00654 TaxID=2975799 RepID=UPI0022531DEE|nr:hypothetical protein [Streptomyces sp. NBC_00654]MCX4970491.1 hypothetical protein [Streptomyces sp. NBC_00654]
MGDAADAGDAGIAGGDVRGDRVDVSRLVPIQRTVPEQDLVIGTSGFEQSLTTRQDTALGTPLGHLVSPEAPAGLVHGITSPAPVSPQTASTAQRSVEMPMRRETVPGREAVSVPASAAVPVAVSVPAPVPAPVQRVHGGGEPAMTSVGEGAVADLPVRQLVGERPLVAPPAPPAPLPAPAPGASGAVQRVVEPSASAGEPHRRVPGLGAPLPGLPPTAQRQAAASVPGGASEGGAEVDEVDDVAEVSGGAEASQVTAPLLGDDPLVGVVSGGGGDGSGSADGGVAGGAAGGLSGGAAVQRSVAVPGAATALPAAPTTAPLLGDRPLVLRTVVGTDESAAAIGPAVQRSPAEGEGSRAGPSGPSAAAPDVVPGSVPDAVPVRWTTADPGASAVAPVGLATAPPAAVQRAVVAPAGGASSTLSRLPVQRRAGAGVSPGGGSRTAIPTAGAFAVAAGVAQRMPDGSVVFPSAPSPSFPSFSSGASRPVVQRDAEISEEPPPPAPVPDPDPVPDPVPDSVPDMEAESDSASAGEGGAPASHAAGAGGTGPGQGGAPAVTDELVRALYAPLSRLLKADLRLERERAGFLINTRPR